MLFTAVRQIWSWLVYLEQQTIFGMTPVVRGDTLNGILQATAREKIIEFKKKEKRSKTIVISANPNWRHPLHLCSLAYEGTYRNVAMDTNLFQKLKELGKVSSFRKFQLFAVNHKEMAAIKNCKTAGWKKR